MIDRLELAAEIKDFLEKHAGIAANYDPEYDTPEDRFNGPDSSMLNAVAESLEMDTEFSFPLSSWGSGCYQPYNDKAAEAWHDAIKAKIKAYTTENVTSSQPRR